VIFHAELREKISMLILGTISCNFKNPLGNLPDGFFVFEVNLKNVRMNQDKSGNGLVTLPI